jgi:hypothetical protein
MGNQSNRESPEDATSGLSRLPVGTRKSNSNEDKTLDSRIRSVEGGFFDTDAEVYEFEPARVGDYEI